MSIYVVAGILPSCDVCAAAVKKMREQMGMVNLPDTDFWHRPSMSADQVILLRYQSSDFDRALYAYETHQAETCHPKQEQPIKIKLAFDPHESTPIIREIFSDVTARTLWCLWKQGHVTRDHFDYLTGTKTIEISHP